MENDNTIRVSAFVPNESGDHLIVDTEGNLPTLEYNPAVHRTYEDTLDDLSKKVVGSSGKIDRRLPEIEQNLNHIVYKTSPVGSTALRAANHSWKKLD